MNVRIFTFIALAGLLLFGPYPSPALEIASAEDDMAEDMAPGLAEHKKVVALNEAGLSAVEEKDFNAAIKKFKAALDLDPHYEPAKKNLIAAYNAFGLSKKGQPKAAIVQFHHALSIDKSDPVTQKNIDSLIKSMGLNPRSAETRIKLADDAQSSGDQEGVGLEMEAADYLKGHPHQDAVYGDSAK